MPQRPEDVPGYRDPDFPNPDGDMDTPIIIYGYTPSLGLAIFAVIWFLLFLVIHTFRTIRSRSWWFIPFVIGISFEIVGYIARCLSAKVDPYHLIYYILNYFFIITAPVLMAASIYTILYVLVMRLGRSYSLLPPKVILWFFIVSDAVATIVQITGASLVGRRSAARQDPTAANNILLAGLAYQVFAMTVFLVIATAFIARARHAIRQNELTVPVAVLGVTTILIYVRTVFRLAETGEGLFGSLQSHEIYFAILEVVPVAIAVLLFGVWHPGELRKSKASKESDGSESYIPLSVRVGSV
ncbi:hypothetical protein JDV02_004585 [Purpureocillium takamizusanense]|uniref:RTA1 like protein n=1 Tax=Purpureocillium takamizusanense TaxID=2060973 RepID=A0A9Q8QFL8_9HYPO|nr:uncharacterized protein JDV02_004585 [Purpureocillium takamizusanense]UNI18311.1 hypothetical protein JDV02_004585 [Purpureocillium takamizusanense]